MTIPRRSSNGGNSCNSNGDNKRYIMRRQSSNNADNARGDVVASTTPTQNGGGSGDPTKGHQRRSSNDSKGTTPSQNGKCSSSHVRRSSIHTEASTALHSVDYIDEGNIVRTLQSRKCFTLQLQRDAKRMKDDAQRMLENAIRMEAYAKKELDNLNKKLDSIAKKEETDHWKQDMRAMMNSHCDSIAAANNGDDSGNYLLDKYDGAVDRDYDYMDDDEDDDIEFIEKEEEKVVQQEEKIPTVIQISSNENGENTVKELQKKNDHTANNIDDSYNDVTDVIKLIEEKNSLDRGMVVKTFRGHSAKVECITTYTKPDSSHNKPSHLFSGSWDNTIKLWNITTGECIKTYAGHIDSVRCIDFAVVRQPQEQSIMITGSDDNSIKLWNITEDLVQSSSSERVSSNSANNICFKCMSTLKGHDDDVVDLKYLGSNKFISASVDSTIKLWSFSTSTNDKIAAASNRTIRTFSGHSDAVNTIQVVSESRNNSIDKNNISTSLSSSLFLSGSDDNTIMLWDLSKFKSCHVRTFEDNACVNCIATVDINNYNDSEQRQYFLSGNDNNIIKLWNMVSGECLSKFVGHTNSITSLSVMYNKKESVHTHSVIDYNNNDDGDENKMLFKNIFFISGSNEFSNNIKLWSLLSDECVHTFVDINSCPSTDEGSSYTIRSLHTYSSSMFFSACGDETIKLWKWT